MPIAELQTKVFTQIQARSIVHSSRSEARNPKQIPLLSTRLLLMIPKQAGWTRLSEDATVPTNEELAFVVRIAAISRRLALGTIYQRRVADAAILEDWKKRNGKTCDRDD